MRVKDNHFRLFRTGYLYRTLAIVGICLVSAVNPLSADTELGVGVVILPVEAEAPAVDNTSAQFHNEVPTITNRHGTVRVVGDPGGNGFGIDGVEVSHSGVVNVYAKNGIGEWYLRQTLTAGNADVSDKFGAALALSDDSRWLAVAAPYEDGDTGGVYYEADFSFDNNKRVDVGAVYVYQYNDEGYWSYYAVIKPHQPEQGLNFGHKLVFSNPHTLTIDSRRAAHAYRLIDKPSVADLSSAEYGTAVAVSGDGQVLVVGAPYARGYALHQIEPIDSAGVAYIYLRTDKGSWQFRQMLTAAHPRSDDAFGQSIDVSGDGSVVAIGAAFQSALADGGKATPGAYKSGAVYVYRRTAEGWQEQAFLKASNAGADNQFGGAVTLSDDGHTLAVGAVGESGDVNQNAGKNISASSGAAYVFAYTDGVWQQQAYLKASDAVKQGAFGFSLALNRDGDRLAVGAVGTSQAPHKKTAGKEIANAGAVYLFERHTDVWSQQAQLSASQPVTNGRFGASVDLDGEVLAVGADGDTAGKSAKSGDKGATNHGAVYLFHQEDSSWRQTARLTASNAGAKDYFGESVSLTRGGRLLAVGAGGEKSSATGVYSDDEFDNDLGDAVGAVYLFEYDDNGLQWKQTATIKPPKAEDFLHFGTALSLSRVDDTDSVSLLAGGKGLAWVGGFVPSRFASHLPGEEGEIVDNTRDTAKEIDFGTVLAVSADGSTLAVGAQNGDARQAAGAQVNRINESGVVYVYVKNRKGRWIRQQTLAANNADSGDGFGISLAMSADGNTIAVGAAAEDGRQSGINPKDSNNAPDAGAVYVFVRQGRTWTQDAYIKASQVIADSQFGYSVALSDDAAILAVGAKIERGGVTENAGSSGNDMPNAGAVYVYVRDRDAWTQQARLKSPNPDADDEFGGSVALSADGFTLAVGAAHESSNATGLNGNLNNNRAESSGAVYVFQYSESTWKQTVYVKASNTDAGDEFGRSVALSPDGDILIVGAHNEASKARRVNRKQSDNRVAESGAVYVFRHVESTWRQTAYIKASNTGEGDQFGAVAALNHDGTLLAVSAYEEGSTATGIYGRGDLSFNNDQGHSVGAVYLYEYEGGEWFYFAVIKPRREGDDLQFGRSVAFDENDNLIIGGDGIAQVVYHDDYFPVLGADPQQLELDEADTGKVIQIIPNLLARKRVTVNIKADKGLTVDQKVLTFTDTQAKSIVVTAVDDSSHDGDREKFITLSATGYQDVKLKVLITEDDVELIVNPTGLQLTESEPGQTVSIAPNQLLRNPLTVSVNASAGLAVDRTALIFTAIDAQEITVTAANNESSGGARIETLTFSAADYDDVVVQVDVSEDEATYGGVAVDEESTELASADEVSAAYDMYVVPSLLVVAEGKSAELTLGFDSAVDLPLSVSVSADAGLDIADEVYVNGIGGQTITVSAADNDTYEGTRQAGVRFYAANDMTAEVAVTIVDDEMPRITDLAVKDSADRIVATVESGTSYSLHVTTEHFPNNDSVIDYQLTMRKPQSSGDIEVLFADNAGSPINFTVPVIDDQADGDYLEVLVTVTAVDEQRAFTGIYPIADEAKPDADNDGVPDFADPAPDDVFHVVATGGSTTAWSALAVPSTPGYRVSLGEIARQRGLFKARIDEVSTMVGIQSPQNYHGEGIYDFTVHLPSGSQTAYVVLPLQSILQQEKTYGRYTNGVWHVFARDAYDEYYSSPAVGDADDVITCPNPTQLVAWTSAGVLARDHRCILLRISDGGSNDADGKTNGIVRFLGAPQ